MADQTCIFNSDQTTAAAITPTVAGLQGIFTIHLDASEHSLLDFNEQGLGYLRVTVRSFVKVVPRL